MTAPTVPTAPLPSLPDTYTPSNGCMIICAAHTGNYVPRAAYDELREHILTMQRERDQSERVLQNNGFVRCDIMACNCGSWHHRYGLCERMDEIKDALTEVEVLNNETGNLPLRAVNKLIEQRQQLREQLAASERTCAELRVDRDEWIENAQNFLKRAEAAERTVADWIRENGPSGWIGKLRQDLAKAQAELARLEGEGGK